MNFFWHKMEDWIKMPHALAAAFVIRTHDLILDYWTTDGPSWRRMCQPSRPVQAVQPWLDFDLSGTSKRQWQSHSLLQGCQHSKISKQELIKGGNPWAHNPVWNRGRTKRWKEEDVMKKGWMKEEMFMEAYRREKHQINQIFNQKNHSNLQHFWN